MKQVKNINFPYPFLMEGNDIFPNAKFSIDGNLKLDHDDIILEYKIYLECDFFEKLIKNNEIFLSINIEQKNYRNSFNVGKLQFDENHQIYGQYKIEDAKNFFAPNHNIEVVCMIIALKKITFCYNNSMNPLYAKFDEEFEYKPGQIIGYSNFEEYEYPNDKKVSSIFTVSEFANKSEKAPYKFDFDNDLIDIKVQPEIKSGFIYYRGRNPDLNKVLNCSLVYPAVEMAIYLIFTDYEAYQDKIWCIQIKNKIEQYSGEKIGKIISEHNNIPVGVDEITKYTNVVLETLLLDAYRVEDGE